MQQKVLNNMKIETLRNALLAVSLLYTPTPAPEITEHGAIFDKDTTSCLYPLYSRLHAPQVCLTPLGDNAMEINLKGTSICYEDVTKEIDGTQDTAVTRCKLPNAGRYEIQPDGSYTVYPAPGFDVYIEGKEEA